MKKTLSNILPLGLLLFPYLAFAQNAQAVERIINRVLGTLNDIIIPLFFVLATVIFLWGVIQYVVTQDEGSQKKAKGLMLWGIIGLAVMLAVWGIVNILIQYFGVGGQGIPTVLPSQ